MKISVITPSLNSGKYIDRAIKSVLAQCYEEFEHIIVDGASTDNTVNILKQYSHLKWISESDRGQSDAMNKGFALSNGDIIVYLNADDYFLPNVFDIVINAFDDETDIVFGNLEMITPSRETVIKVPSTQYQDILEHWKSLFPLNPVQYFYRRKLQEGIVFNVDNHFAMDHEFLLSITKNTSITHIDKIFGVFDMVEGSKTAEGTQEAEQYWRLENFSYIDHFLHDMPLAYVLGYKKEQYRFYNTRIVDRYEWLKGKYEWEIKRLNMQFSKALFNSIDKLLLWRDKQKKIVLYGAGSQTKALYPYVKEYTVLIVDNSKEQQGKIVGSHQVKSLDAMRSINDVTVLVTPVGYKTQIEASLAEICDLHVEFIEDIMELKLYDSRSSEDYELFRNFI